MILMTLVGCRASVPPMPLTERVYCSVTAIVGDTEYRFSVEKDSDEIAIYRFLYPDVIDGLTYEFVGNECTVSFCGLSFSPADSISGVADLLHEILTFDRSLLRYEEDGYFADSESGRFRILTLSDGNVSEIVSQDDEIHLYFNYAP